MPQNHSDNIVEEWTSLMDEWASASKALDVVLAAAGSIDHVAMPEWQRTVDEARQRQNEVKQRIDEIISGALASRSAPVDGLIVGQIAESLPLAALSSTQQSAKKRS